MPCLVITGKKGEGKTYLVDRLAEKLLEKGLSVEGLVTRGQEKKIFVDVRTKKEEVFWKEGDLLAEEIGQYKISERALTFAYETIEKSVSGQIIIIDEIGWLEAEKRGLFEAVKKLVTRKNQSGYYIIILVVRRQIVEKIPDLFGINIQKILVHEKKNYEANIAEIIERVFQNNV